MGEWRRRQLLCAGLKNFFLHSAQQIFNQSWALHPHMWIATAAKNFYSRKYHPLKFPSHRILQSKILFHILTTVRRSTFKRTFDRALKCLVVSFISLSVTRIALSQLASQLLMDTCCLLSNCQGLCYCNQGVHIIGLKNHCV